MTPEQGKCAANGLQSVPPRSKGSLEPREAKPCRVNRPTKIPADKGVPLMTTLLAQLPHDEAPQIACHDHVRVPDGRVGEIMGFYRRSVESALVSFSGGASEEFLITDVEAL